MILKNDGSLWATGNNTWGQLGTGDTNSIWTLTPVMMSGVAAVSAGLGHTMILKNDGTLWATGYNYPGTLGTGDTTHVLTPVNVWP